MRRLTALFLVATGCAAHLAAEERILREQVAFVSKCPPERINVVRWGPGGMLAEVDVCGTLGTYQNTTSYVAGAPQRPNWLEVASGAAQAPPPQVEVQVK